MYVHRIGYFMYIRNTRVVCTVNLAGDLYAVKS